MGFNSDGGRCFTKRHPKMDTSIGGVDAPAERNEPFPAAILLLGIAQDAVVNAIASLVTDFGHMGNHETPSTAHGLSFFDGNDTKIVRSAKNGIHSRSFTRTWGSNRQTHTSAALTHGNPTVSGTAFGAPSLNGLMRQPFRNGINIEKHGSHLRKSVALNAARMSIQKSICASFAAQRFRTLYANARPKIAWASVPVYWEIQSHIVRSGHWGNPYVSR